MAVLDEVGLVGFSDEDGSTGSDDVGRIVVLLGHSVQLTTHVQVDTHTHSDENTVLNVLT